MENKYRLVYWENPLTIHSRLHLHHGLFLCSGDIKRSFQDNIINLSGWNKETSILKINCTMELEDLRDGLEECRRMNLTRESLFPGLDGFSQAMNYQLSFYHSMWQNRNEII